MSIHETMRFPERRRAPDPRFLQRVQDGEPWEAVAAALPDPGSLALLKMLLLQRWLGAGDADLLSEIDDRVSYRRFCGLDPGEALPHEEDLRRFRERLATANPGLLKDLGERWCLAAADPLISVVSPVYRAEEIVDEFVRSVTRALESITANFEIVLVEDGSGDGTWARIASACAADPRVKGVKLSRNFGQHPATTAGLAHARGQWTAVMDCDLQDDPSFLPDLFAKACDGFDVVLTERRERAHSWIRNACARLFVSVLNRLSGDRAADALVGAYSMLSRRAVEAFLGIGDVHRHYLTIVRWMGFRTALVPVVHRPRHRGRSSYNLAKLMRHGIDGWISHSNRPLYASVALGFTCLVAAIAGALLVIVLSYVRGFAPGWPSLVVLILACTGAILTSLGVLSIYVAKIFDQVRARPLYIVEHTVNVEPAPPRAT